MSKGVFAGTMLALLVSTGAKGDAAEITGRWAGSLQLEKPSTSPLRIEFSKTPEGIKGVLDAPFAGLRKKALEKISIAAAKIHFEVPLEKGTWIFDGKIIGPNMEGTQQVSGQTGTFQLTHLRTLNAEELHKYFGIYQLASNRMLYIRTWDELGDNQLSYLDSQGNIGPIFLSTTGKFFAGGTLWVPSPERARIEFRNDGSFVWSVANSAALNGTKIHSFQERDVAFQSGRYTLAGTLLIPEGKSPHPGIVFVHGSGRVTRDFMGPLAYHFVQNGIAVLSYDKRGAGKSEGDWLDAGFPELAEDARNAVRFLKTQDGIDPHKIGIFGISQGGWIGPLAAAENPDVSFLMMISAPAVTPLQQEISRTREELKVDGIPEKTIAEQTNQLKEQIDSLRDETVLNELRAQLKTIQSEGKHELLSESDPANPHFLLWYSKLMDHDPIPILKKLECPVLAIYGSLDRGVSPSENQPILEKIFRQSGVKYTIHVFPNGNHALLESSTGSMKEFPFLKRFVPGFLDLMVSWVKEKAATISKNSES